MTYLATEKLDLDQILVLNQAIKNDTDNILSESNQINQATINLLPTTAPYFIYTNSIQRPANTTPYTAGQAFGVSASTALIIPLGSTFANKIIQIDEINFVDNNTNTPITPTMYISNTAFNTVDQVIPVLSMGSFTDYMETIVGVGMVKIPGNAGNCNILKSLLTNLNIKLQCDAGGNLYYVLVASVGFTPIANETFNFTIKGRIC